MRTFNVSGIVNVNMYNTLLDPAVTLDDDFDDLTESDKEALWDRFDLKAYVAKVCELAVEQLVKLLKKLPESLHCSYVEGSASILSPKYYNYFGDELYFQLFADTNMTEKAFQEYLDAFFRDDWNAEFGSDYGIYAELRENCTIYGFLKEAAQ